MKIIQTIRKFGLEYCDVGTMIWNVSVMLRILVLNIDGRNKTPIPLIFYIVAVSVVLGYFYVYLVSMAWFVFIRCPANGDLVSAIVVFSLGVSSEIGTVKLVYMLTHIGQVRDIVTQCLACDSTVVPGSRFSNNLLTTLRQVKKRAMIFWVVIIGNGVVYVLKPALQPGRHFTEDIFILYARNNAWEEIGKVFHPDWDDLTSSEKQQRVLHLSKKWRNVRDYYIKEKKMARKSKETGVMKRKYNYYDSLTFLDNTLKRQRITNDYGGDDIIIEDYLEDTKSSDNCDEDSDESSRSITVKEEREELLMNSTPTLDFETHMLPSERSQEDDTAKANKNFLLSLLPDVSSLNARQNMTFRLGVLNLINNIKFNNNKQFDSSNN